ncbi:ABC transporter substrate-binding protein [Leucobacter rhizosphaerae]|uniref:ABC transporter substrate-binding protein n=1 Tax=Leucobacter rhizosphaerae TaxID=2932245 RepID=A0ABY4FTT8_9MICO|nr:ABC transporter substrate-binding protein [Leucobacter rhizosphaerae]UOQ59718.1 ABC transporter substrate-binding protein [Leucobacter rhizosphaerae]
MTTRTTITAATGAAALAATLLLSACAPGGSSAAGAGDPVEGGTLTWAIAAEPSCFAPAFHQLLSDRAVIRNYVDSLVYQEEDGSFTPWLAESWEVSEDGTEYTFTLASDVTFTDGAALDAAAVKTNLDFTRDAANGSTYAGLLGSVADIAADGQVLTITLSAPDSSLLDSLSSVALGIVSPEGVALGDELCAIDSGLAGTGPFVLGDYTRGDQLALTRNDDYTSAPESLDHGGPAYLESVTYKFMPEDSVRIGALESGQVDAISGIPALDVAGIEGNAELQYLNGPSTSMPFGFTINADAANAPWDDPALRQAFRDSFDVDAIVESVYRGEVARAYSYVGSDSPEFDESLVDAWGNNPDGANAQLDAAGWDERDDEGFRTKDGERLTLSVTYDSDSVRDSRDTVIEAVQDQAAKNVGIEVDFTTPTWAEVSADIADGTWSVYPGSFGKVDYANNVIGVWGGFFFAATDYQPTGAIDAATAAATALTPEDRSAALRTVQQELVIDEAIFVPVAESTFQIAARTSVGGLGFDYSSANPDGNYGVWVAASE